MASTCTKVKKTISRQDLFGVPVLLSFEGERAFNTFFGGVLSVAIVVALTVGFICRLHKLISQPVFMTLPEAFAFGRQIVSFPTSESTVAVQVFNVAGGKTIETLRVQFSQ